MGMFTDVVVIEDCFGKRKASPIHVLFKPFFEESTLRSKYGRQVLIPAAEEVEMYINGQLIKLTLVSFPSKGVFFFKGTREELRDELRRNPLPAELSEELRGECEDFEAEQQQVTEDISRLRIERDSLRPPSPLLSAFRVVKSAVLYSPRLLGSKKRSIREIHLQLDENKFTKAFPNEECLRDFPLRMGENTIVWKTLSTHQKAKARIFLWRSTDHIVVSDIDGTITKSDTRGHIYERIGWNWHHEGISDLFESISERGYRFIYVTSRSFKMQQYTCEFLHTLGVPLGPVFTTPNGYFRSLKREFFDSNPEEGKLAHLWAIIEAFGESPFVAGFGNRISDRRCYEQIGIPSNRIFLVDKTSVFQPFQEGAERLNFLSMSQMIGQFFPNFHKQKR